MAAGAEPDSDAVIGIVPADRRQAVRRNGHGRRATDVPPVGYAEITEKGTEMNFNAPSWLGFLIAVLVILLVLYLLGIRVDVG